MLNLTPGTTRLFTDLVEDAGNWSGTPLFGGNVGDAPADKGHLTDLKKHGLLVTFDDKNPTTGRPDSWVYFTEAGKKHATELGLNVVELEVHAAPIQTASM